MTILKRYLAVIILLLIPFTFIFPFEFGVQLGTINNKPSSLAYGFSGGGGFMLPMLKLEVELYKMQDYAYQALTAGVKFRPKLARLVPYAILGVGCEYKTFNFAFSEYRWFTFIGGGIHFYLNDLFSLRGDIRLQNFSNMNKTRLCAGIFIHI